jgi:hypothetical protein
MKDDFGSIGPLGLDEVQRKKALSQALLQKFAGGQQQEFVPGGTGTPIAVKGSGLSALAQALTGFVANDSAQKFGAQEEGIKRQYAEQVRAQKMAEDLIKARDARTKALISGVSGDNPQFAADIARTNQIPDKVPPPPVGPIGKDAEFGTFQGPNGPIATVKNYDLKGKVTGSFGPGSTNVSATANTILPNKIGEIPIDATNKDLIKWKEVFDDSRNVLANNQRAIQAIEAGAQAGGFQDIKQTVRKVIQALGGDPKGLSETEDLNQALGDAVLESIRKLAPVTNEDLKFVKDIKGSINTDPQALIKALSYTSAAAIKTMHNFNDYLSQQEQSLSVIKDPTQRDALRTLFAGQRIGREAPSNLPGNRLFQLETAQNLKNRQFDMSRLQGLPPEFLEDIAKGTVQFQNSMALPKKAPASGRRVMTLDEFEKFKANGYK